MIPELGHYALVLALLVAVVQASIPLVGAARGDEAWMALARPAALAQLVLVAISYDPPDTLADVARRNDITFPLLADPGSRTIDAYGIRDPQGNGYPHPQIFVVAPEGIVGAVLSKEGFQTRPTTDQLIEAAGRVK